VRVARLHDRGNVQLHEEARPEPADGMSLVRVTDVGLRHQRPPARRARIPCEGFSSPGEKSSAPARHDGSRTRMVQPAQQRSSEQVTPNDAGPLPSREAPRYPVGVRCPVAITHTFRHIFWPQLATTSHNQPQAPHGEKSQISLWRNGFHNLPQLPTSE
jgi:hypothetical protein